MSELLRSEAVAVVAPLQAALRDLDLAGLARAIDASFSSDARVHLFHPIETISADDVMARAWAPLAEAMPDLERRDLIVMAGPDGKGEFWVGCCGYYVGTFQGAFLGIPPSGHAASLRYHEFFRVEGGKVVEMQAVWDLPELMMQAGVWPMVPSLGREWHVPGPAAQDGLTATDRTPDQAASSLALVGDMLEGLSRFATDGAQGMNLEAYWHPNFSWYGPSGIGTGRGIAGFRNWHQIPFLNGMPDRVGNPDLGHFFADGPYVGFTAWPGMQMSISGDGWLGIAPSGQQITMRSLDFWRCEDGRIRENWVLIDLLHVYAQIGVDVLARMRELAHSRHRAG